MVTAPPTRSTSTRVTGPAPPVASAPAAALIRRTPPNRSLTTRALTTRAAPKPHSPTQQHVWWTSGVEPLAVGWARYFSVALGIDQAPPLSETRHQVHARPPPLRTVHGTRCALVRDRPAGNRGTGNRGTGRRRPCSAAPRPSDHRRRGSQAGAPRSRTGHEHAEKNSAHRTEWRRGTISHRGAHDQEGVATLRSLRRCPFRYADAPETLSQRLRDLCPQCSHSVHSVLISDHNR